VRNLLDDFVRLTVVLLLPLLCTPMARAQDSTESDAETPRAEASGTEKADDEPKPEALFTEGRNALFQGKYQEAIELLNKAVAADDSKTGYRLHLARAYRYAGKTKEAAEQLEKILKTAADHVEAGQALGEIYSADERWKDVVRVLEPLLKYRHDYPTYHMLAEAEYNLDDHEKARKHYEEAVKLNPESAADHYQLGNIYLSGNFFALAAESYQAALRRGLDSPVLRYKLGSAYFNLRNYFGRITVQTIKSGKVGTIHGGAYLIEPVPGTEETFRCAPETSAVYQVARAVADGLEEQSDIRVLRATIYLNARRYAQALEMFAQLAQATGEDAVPEADRPLVHYYHAQAAFGTGQYDRYLELLKEAIKLDPEAYESTLVDAYIKVADQYNQAGKLDKYIEYLALAVGETPQTASLHLKLGNAYEEARKHDLAIAQWQMVLDLEPDHGERMKLLNLIQRYRTNLGVSVVVPPSEPKPSAQDGQEKQ